MRRGFALTVAVALGGACAALPSAVASGDATGGSSAPTTPAPAAPALSSGTSSPDPAPTGDSAPPPASPGQPSLSTPAGAVVRQAVSLKGAVNAADAGRAVAVQQRADDGSWADVGTIASDSDGSFTVRWRPTTAGKVALRAVLADAQGARAADAAPEIDVTVFKRTRATWFGPGMYGERTACGQRLSSTLLGVAHRSLPCGSKVQLYYNGETVTVPVIDRGPYANGATFDLTKATADKLGADGVFRVGYAIIQG